MEGPGITGASPHRHYTYQETHIVIEGEYECRLGSETFVLGPGGMTFAPKGMVHGMRKLGDGVGRQLLISSPAGVFESFVAEVTAAQADTGTVGRAGSIDFRQICAKYGIEFVDEPRPPGTTPPAAPTGGDAP